MSTAYATKKTNKKGHRYQCPFQARIKARRHVIFSGGNDPQRVFHGVRAPCRPVWRTCLRTLHTGSRSDTSAIPRAGGYAYQRSCYIIRSHIKNVASGCFLALSLSGRCPVTRAASRGKRNQSGTGRITNASIKFAAFPFPFAGGAFTEWTGRRDRGGQFQ